MGKGIDRDGAPKFAAAIVPGSGARIPVTRVGSRFLERRMMIERMGYGRMPERMGNDISADARFSSAFLDDLKDRRGGEPLSEGSL